MKKNNDETTDDFMTRCRNQANKCKFRDQKELEERLIEQLIVGTKHQKAQERILEHGAVLTLDKAVKFARTNEATITHVAQLCNTNTEQVQAIGKMTPGQPSKCGNCGTIHEQRKCPAYGTNCNYCSRRNHNTQQKHLSAQHNEILAKTAEIFPSITTA